MGSVSPKLEEDHKPPHRGADSLQNLLTPQFRVLLPGLLLVWDVALKQASPNTHRGSSSPSIR